MIDFGEENPIFGINAPWMVSCQQIETQDCFDNGLKVVIETNEHRYEITFRNYTLLQVRPEHLTVWDGYEIRHGNYLVIFDRSRLLDYWSQVILHPADYSYPGKGIHYGIYTETHLIDIIASEKPEIKQIQ